MKKSKEEPQSANPLAGLAIIGLIVIVGVIGISMLKSDAKTSSSADTYSEAQLPVVKDGKQAAAITVNSTSYSPKIIALRKDTPADLTFLGQGGGCSTAIISRDFWDGVIFVNKGDEKTVSFTPTKTGRFKYTCTMGMYTGWIDVV